MRIADWRSRIRRSGSGPIRNPKSTIRNCHHVPVADQRTPSRRRRSRAASRGRFVRAQLDGVLARLDPPDAEQRVREAHEVLVVVDRVQPSDATRGDSPTRSRPLSTKARALPWRSRTGIAADSHPTRRARAAARPRQRSRRSCSRSTTRGAPAPGAMASEPSWSTTNRSSCPTPGGVWRRVRWIPGTKPRYESRRRILREVARAKGIPLDAPWKDLTERARHFLLNGASGRFLGMLPFLQRLEAKRYKQYIRVFLRQYQLAKVCPPAAARGSSRKRWRCMSAAARSRMSRRFQSASCVTGSRGSS